MNTKKLPLKVIATVALSGLFLTACDDSRVRVSANIGTHVGGHHGHHGKYLTHTPHRHRVSYNSALGMYVVLGLLNTYYSNGHYYRYSNAGWHRSRDYRVWSVLSAHSVPKRLYSRHYKKSSRSVRGGSHRGGPRRGHPSNHIRWNY